MAKKQRAREAELDARQAALDAEVEIRVGAALAGMQSLVEHAQEAERHAAAEADAARMQLAALEARQKMWRRLAGLHHQAD